MPDVQVFFFRLLAGLFVFDVFARFLAFCYPTNKLLVRLLACLFFFIV